MRNCTTSMTEHWFIAGLQIQLSTSRLSGTGICQRRKLRLEYMPNEIRILGSSPERTRCVEFAVGTSAPNSRGKCVASISVSYLSLCGFIKNTNGCGEYLGKFLGHAEGIEGTCKVATRAVINHLVNEIVEKFDDVV